MGGPIMELTREVNAFVGKELMCQVAPSQQGGGAVSAYFQIDSQRLRDIKAMMAKVPPDQTVPAQLQPTMALFRVLNAKGGSYGLGYERQKDREPRSPDDVLRTKKADCDELCMAYYAVARALGLNVSGIALSRFTLADPTGTMPHGVLTLTDRSRRFVIDLTLDRPLPVSDFSDATMRVDLATRLGFAGGNTAMAAKTVMLRERHDMGFAKDMAASQLLERAQYLAPVKGPVSVKELETALASMRDAIGCGSAHAEVAAQTQQVALTLFKRYFDSAESAYSGKRFKEAEQRYLSALEVHGLVPKISSNHEDAIYRAHETLGRIFASSGRLAEAVSRYAETRRLKPDARPNYDAAIRLLDRLARDTKNPQRMAHAQEGLKLSTEAKIRFGTTPAIRKGYEKAERYFQKLVQNIAKDTPVKPSTP